MKSPILIRALALLFLAAAPAALAQTPALLNYQGRVQTGTPPADFNGTGQFKFALMEGTTATRLWNNNGPVSADPVNAVSLTVTNGLYSVILGDNSLTNMAAIPAGVFAKPDVRLRVWFNGQQLSPDQRLAPNGYLPTEIGTALRLKESLTLSDKPMWFRSPNDTNHGLGYNALQPFKDSLATIDGPVLFGCLGGALGTRCGAESNYALYWDDTGRVGIGTTTPAEKLSVSGNVSVTGNISFTTNGASGGDINNVDVIHGLGGLALYSNQGGSGIYVAAGGNVGIGTTDPAKAKLVISGAADYVHSPGTIYPYGQLTAGGASTALGNVPANTTFSTSLFASGDVVAANYRAVSDARTKRISGQSDGTEDLAALRQVQVTDYTYVDVIARGSAPQKKVIAQQVECVFPQAVNKGTDTVPDIFKKAPVADGWVELKTDLKAGERVRLIGEKAEGIHEVLELRDGAFRTAFQTADKEIFVYGREVNDFRTVDYEAIAMLNVSATQELARQLDAEKADTLAKEKEITALKERLADLEAKDAARDAKLAALVKMMEDRRGEAKTATVSTVSTQP